MIEPGLTTLLLIAVADSLLLEHLAGMTALVSCARRSEPARIFALLISVALPAVVLLLWLVDLQLQALGLPVLRLPVWVLILALVVTSGQKLTTRFAPRQAALWNPLLKLMLLNSLFVAAALLLSQQQTGLAGALTVALGMGLGLAVLIPVFAAMSERLQACQAPMALQGLPLRVMTLGLMALGLQGFGTAVLQ